MSCTLGNHPHVIYSLGLSYAVAGTLKSLLLPPLFFHHVPSPGPTDVTSQTFPDSVPSSVFILSLLDYCKLFLSWLLYVQLDPPTKMQWT